MKNKIQKLIKLIQAEWDLENQFYKDLEKYFEMAGFVAQAKRTIRKSTEPVVEGLDKTLLGLIKKIMPRHTALTILKKVCVYHSGALYATNLDLNLVIENSGLKEGLHTLDYLLAGRNTPETTDLGDFPKIPDDAKNEKAFTLPASIFQGHNFAGYATSDEVRMTLKGVYFDKKKKSIVATDGHRMIVHENKRLDIPDSFVLPKEAFPIVEALVKHYHKNSRVHCWLSPKYVRFRIDRITFVVKQIEGSYPMWEKVIPKFSKKVIAIKDHAQVSDWIKTNKSLLNKRTSQGAFDEGGVLYVKTNDGKLIKTKTGFALQDLVGFNLVYLKQILDDLKSQGSVKLSCGTALSAHVFRVPEFTYLLMPTRLTNEEEFKK